MTPLGPLGARPYRFEQKYCPNRLCDFESHNTPSELNSTHYEQAPAFSSSEHISTVTKSLKFELEVSKALSTCILLFQYTPKFFKI